MSLKDLYGLELHDFICQNKIKIGLLGLVSNLGHSGVLKFLGLYHDSYQFDDFHLYLMTRFPAHKKEIHVQYVLFGSNFCRFFCEQKLET